MTALINCHINKPIEAMGAELQLFNLQGSRVSGLMAQGVKVKSDALLSHDFHAIGEVSFLGANIGGHLSCQGGTFENPERIALIAQSATVKDALFWREVKKIQGKIHLVNLDTQQALADDEASWSFKDMEYRLNGMTYQSIVSKDFTADVSARLEWLEKGSIEEQKSETDKSKTKLFTPQPYSQCAKTMRKMGFDLVAKKVFIERERLINKHTQKSFFRRG